MGYTKEIWRRNLQAHDYDTGMHKIIRVVDKKATGTNGGGSSVGWNVRDLTDIAKNPGSLATLDTNKVTLPAGAYEVSISSPVHGAVGVSRVKVVNTTPTTPVDLVVGQTIVGLANLGQMVSVCDSFELTEESEVQVEVYTANAVVDTGLGLPGNIAGYDEIFTVVEFRQETDPNVGDRADV